MTYFDWPGRFHVYLQMWITMGESPRPRNRVSAAYRVPLWPNHHYLGWDFLASDQQALRRTWPDYFEDPSSRGEDVRTLVAYLRSVDLAESIYNLHWSRWVRIQWTQIFCQKTARLLSFGSWCQISWIRSAFGPIC